MHFAMRLAVLALVMGALGACGGGGHHHDGGAMPTPEPVPQPGDPSNRQPPNRIDGYGPLALPGINLIPRNQIRLTNRQMQEHFVISEHSTMPAPRPDRPSIPASHHQLVMEVACLAYTTGCDDWSDNPYVFALGFSGNDDDLESDTRRMRAEFQEAYNVADTDWIQPVDGWFVATLNQGNASTPYTFLDHRFHYWGEGRDVAMQILQDNIGDIRIMSVSYGPTARTRQGTSYWRRVIGAKLQVEFAASLPFLVVQSAGNESRDNFFFATMKRRHARLLWMKKECMLRVNLSGMMRCRVTGVC